MATKTRTQCKAPIYNEPNSIKGIGEENKLFNSFSSSYSGNHKIRSVTSRNIYNLYEETYTCCKVAWKIILPIASIILDMCRTLNRFSKPWRKAFTSPISAKRTHGTLEMVL